MSVQFYWYPGSSPSRAVKYFLTATNTPYETHFVDIFAGDQKKEDYLKINLRGKVPAIVDGDFQLAESSTILRYLATSRSAPEFWYPKDVKARAQVDCFLDYLHTGLRKSNVEAAYAAIWGRLNGDVPLDKELFDKSVATFSKEVSYIDELLGKHKWIASDEQPTIADVQLGAELEYADVYRYDFSPYKNIARYFTQLRSLPHWNESHEEFKQSIPVVQKQTHF